MKYLHSFILFRLCFGLNAQNTYDSGFYLIDIKPQFVFDKGEKHDLDSILKLYHATNNDTLRFNYLKILSEGLNTEYLWTNYNDYLYRKVKGKPDSLSKFFEGTALNNFVDL